MVLITLDSRVNLTVKSVRSTQRSTAREISAEAGASPLAALPPARTDAAFQLEANIQRQLQGTLAASVTEVLPGGTLRIRASRRWVVSGAVEELSLEGVVSTASLRAGRVALEEIADLKITLRVPAQGGQNVPERPSDEAVLRRYWAQFWDALSSEP